jgi:group I intron endonuclease
MFVYILTNKINGKQYVGQTTLTPDARWRLHISAARNGSEDCPIFYRAIRKYGQASFEMHFIALPEDSSQALLDRVEIRTIAKLSTMSPAGYNIREGGHGGGRMSEETRLKMSAAHQGQKMPPRSADWRSKQSAAQKGKLRGPRTAETRAKISCVAKGIAGRRKTSQIW